MPVTGFDHFQLAIPEGGEEKARSFFVDLLGMEEVAKPAALSPKGCWFTAGTAALHVGIDPDFRPARKAHPALLVGDLESLRKRLEAAGMPTRDEIPLEGYRRFFTEDPFGNRIELMQKAQA